MSCGEKPSDESSHTSREKGLITLQQRGRFQGNKDTGYTVMNADMLRCELQHVSRRQEQSTKSTNLIGHAV